MSCEINVIGKIVEVEAVRRCLFPTDDLRGSDNWLQSCELSVSPTGDIIAIANERKLVILSAKWDSFLSQNQFQILYSGTAHETDSIKAVICLPIVAETRSSHVVPDWTCVLLGFGSGFIRCYTDNCDLLLEEQLHCEVIKCIKCRSQHHPRPDLVPKLHPENIYVQYQTILCKIDTKQFVPVVRRARTILAHAQAHGHTSRPLKNQLTPQKFDYKLEAPINDFAMVGLNLDADFDYLVNTSTYEGYRASYYPSPPISQLVLAAGSRPFLGYHIAYKRTMQPALTDFAKALVGVVKHSLPTWLVGPSAPRVKPTAANMPSDTLTYQFGLTDHYRTATKIVLSPNHKLAAVSDSLGRVLLIDAYRGIVLRIFKGYRDAQCSFSQVHDQRHSKHRPGNKVAIFLIIYSPKKGTIEFFTIQGQRIAAFTAAKFSRLVYNNYGLIGFTERTSSRFICHFDTVLIDNTGELKEILIPFHFALPEKSNKRARDFHVFKKMKDFVRAVAPEEEVLKRFLDLKTAEIVLQAFEFLVAQSTTSVALILDCVQFIEENYAELEIIARNVKILVLFFNFIKEDPVVENEEASELRIDERLMTFLQKVLNILPQDRPAAVIAPYSEDIPLPPSAFLAIFDLKAESVTMKAENEVDLLYFVSRTLFIRYIAQVNLERLNVEILQSTIPPSDLLKLLILYWVERSYTNHNIIGEMGNLCALIRLLAKLTRGGGDAEFWAQIRESLSDSARPFPALTAAIACKSVLEEIDECSGSTEDSLEILTHETVAWGLLIAKLEDVSMLSVVLSRESAVMFSRLPKLTHEPRIITVNYMRKAGKGVVSELVAFWLTIGGIDANNLVINDFLLRKFNENGEVFDDNKEGDDDEAPEVAIDPKRLEELKKEMILHFLNILKLQFPYSLDVNTLLANMAFAYTQAFRKNLQRFDYLKAAIECLSLLKDSHIRLGICGIAWNTHLKIPFECAAKLINKVGCLPKPALCKQVMEMTDTELGTFFEFITRFFELFQGAVQESLEVKKPTLKFEPTWDDDTKTLVQLALEQKTINLAILHLHYQLSIVLELITGLPVKKSKPLNHLFESYMPAFYFVDFHSEGTIKWDYVDLRVENYRRAFLHNVISASLESGVTVTDGRPDGKVHHTWMGKCLNIGGLWNFDEDALRIYQISQLYRLGFDEIGFNVFPLITKGNALGIALLQAAGRRLAKYLQTAPKYGQNMAVLSTRVVGYIRSLSEEECAPCTLKELENLLHFSFECLDDSVREYKIADAMLDGVQTLQRV